MRILPFLALLAFLLPLALAHETGEPHLELPPGAQQVLDDQTRLALSVNFLIAFLAGIIGFVSPCGFVVLPAFLSFLFKERKRAVFLTIAFAFGILLSFVTLGVIAGTVGVFFSQLKREFAVVSGTLLIAFGLMMLLNKGFSFLTFRMDHPKKQHTFISMAALGFFFALGWTPCVGPILSGILILAANTGTVLAGALMLAAYAVGVSVPLLLVAWLSDKYDFARLVQRGHLELSIFGKTVHTHWYNIIGGLLLIGIGTVIAVFKGSQAIEGWLVDNTPWTMDALYRINDAILASPLTSGAAGFAGIAVLALVIWLVLRALRKDAPTKNFK
jgi:cytochrome c biogenesis protein CcdA